MNNNLNGTYLSSLTSETQNMIGNTKYYLGGYDGYKYQNGLIQTPVDMYSYERKTKNTKSNEFYYGSNPNSFIGKIGVMYASDYGYAINSSYKNNWLFTKGYEWTMTAYGSSNPVIVNYNGGLNNYYAYRGFAVRPVLYLKSNVYVISGDGSEGNPYKIMLGS